MENIILIIHVVIAVLLIGSVLLQRSEGGALGIGAGNDSLMSSRSAGNFLTLLHHKGTVLFPVGPKSFRDWGERLITKFQNTFVSELGIRQFYVCEKY